MGGIDPTDIVPLYCCFSTDLKTGTFATKNVLLFSVKLVITSRHSMKRNPTYVFGSEVCMPSV